jgi:integrase
MCRESRPDGAHLTHWGELVDRYLEHIETQVRSSENPHGISPKVPMNKRSRLAHVEHWLGMHIDLVTPKFVTDQLDELELKGFSRTLTNHILQEVKCAFTFGVHLGAIKASPFAGMKMRRVPKRRKEALTHDEVDELLAQAKRRSHPYYHVWLLTIALGLRRSELAGLKWLDIDFDQRLVYLRRQMIPKEGVVLLLKDREERVVAIPDYIIPVLKELKLRATTDFVIELDCPRWKMGHQAEVLREFCREIGIKEVTHHQLRATHITLALIDGVPLGIVKENVGHAKLSTTDGYFRSSGIQMKGQTDALRIRVPQDRDATVIPLKSGG